MTGIVYTARDAAHKKIVAAMDAGEKLPFGSGRCGDLLRRPDPAKPGQVIGSVGRRPPAAWTRSRPSARRRPVLHDRQGRAQSERAGRDGAQRRGLHGRDRRRRRSKGCFYQKVEVIAYDELGCESVKRLTVENFSAIVSQDSVGGNLYTEGVAKYKKD